MASNVEIIVTATDQASGALKGVGGSLEKLGGVAGKIAAVGMAALAAGISAAGAAAAYFVSAASEAETVAAKFNAIVGSSALADYRGEMIALADSLSQVTRFEDENILAAEAQLALYENIGQDIFPQVINTALDLAEAMGTDAVSGAETLGRALADIGGGSLSLLSRQKLLTKEQVAIAEAMAETEGAAAAQEYVLGILEGKIGTLAETMGQTFSGQITILKNNFGNLAEELGGKLLPVLTPVIAKFSELLEKYGPAISAFFDQIIVPGLTNAVTAFLKFIDTLSSGNFNLGEWLKSIDFGALSQMLIDGINSIDWNAAGQSMNAGLQILAEVIKNFITQVDWTGLFSSLGSAFADFATGLGGGSAEQFRSVWESNIMQLIQIFQKLPAVVSAVVSQLGAYLTGQGAVLIAGFASGIMAGITIIAATFRRISMSAQMVLRNSVTAFRAIGKAILEGLKAGIMAGWNSFTEWLTAAVEQIVEAVLSTLGIQSPSKVFANIGEQMMAGMAVGIGEGVTIPVKAMQAAIPQVVGATIAPSGYSSQNNYYYGSRFLLSAGQDGQILSALMD